ncbi:MAG: hypothetical protein IPH41_10180 [Sulfuritalea sp.]|jgi:hypothetical protein|nr:hypothetical protein [Sulfuritalea sp.]
MVAIVLVALLSMQKDAFSLSPLRWKRVLCLSVDQIELTNEQRKTLLDVPVPIGNLTGDTLRISVLALTNDYAKVGAAREKGTLLVRVYAEHMRTTTDGKVEIIVESLRALAFPDMYTRPAWNVCQQPEIEVILDIRPRAK